MTIDGVNSHVVELAKLQLRVEMLENTVAQIVEAFRALHRIVEQEETALDLPLA
jgi:hypothetical protein